MPGSHKPYPAEFRQQLIELVNAGRTPRELAEEFEPTADSVRNWVKQAAIDQGEHSDVLSTVEKKELARLRREIKQLRQERDILAKAAAWFARETGAVPSKSSSS